MQDSPRYDKHTHLSHHIVLKVLHDLLAPPPISRMLNCGAFS
jgi:hypothetical protein